MDPNNQQQPVNDNLNKLEDDLKKLTEQAASTVNPMVTQEVVNPPTQPFMPHTENVDTFPSLAPIPEVTSQPTVVTPSATDIPTPLMPPEPKKGMSLVNIALIVTVFLLLLAVGYIVYVKFSSSMTISPSPTPVSEEVMESPIPEVVVPTEVPVAADPAVTTPAPTELPAP
jgi:hypothetical protein